MSTKKTVNPSVSDQRNERHHRDLNSGDVFRSQDAAHQPPSERGDARRTHGGPGKSDKPAEGHTSH